MSKANLDVSYLGHALLTVIYILNTVSPYELVKLVQRGKKCVLGYSNTLQRLCMYSCVWCIRIDVLIFELETQLPQRMKGLFIV